MSGAAPDPLGTALIRPGRSAPGPDGRRRVHPLTPLVHGLRVLPIVVVVGISVLSRGRPGEAGTGVLLTLVAAVVLAAAVTGLRYLAWRRLTFWFDPDGDLRVDSGVLTRQERRVQLSRLQSVEVAAPLLARVVGLAEVRVEAAGRSKAVLQFLTTAEAQDLRNEIVARAAGVRPDAGEAPEQVLAQVPPGALVTSLVLRGSTALMLVLTVAVVVTTVLLAGPAALGLVLLGGVPIFAVFSEFATYYGFTVAASGDGLRLRHGLLRTEHQTVPPGRVQAIGFAQPLLWRRRDWVRVRLNVAGRSRDNASGDQGHTEHMLLPVAPWPVARAIVAHILPGVDLTAISLDPAPARARWRAPIQWRRLAVGWDDTVLLTRRGRLERRWAVQPHARTQSVRVTQGPWQRSLGLASVWFDSTPGPVTVVAAHRDAEQAQELALAQAGRASTARAGDRTVRWAKPSP